MVDQRRDAPRVATAAGQRAGADPDLAIAALARAASSLGATLTPDDIAIGRASAAVARLDAMIEAMRRDGTLTSHCSDEAHRREPGKCRWIANLHQLHGWGRSVSQIVELPHVEHVGKSRFSILGGFGLAYRFICARRRRRWRCPRRRLGYNGTLWRSSTKRWSNWRGAKSGDRPERDRKRFQGSTDSAAAHIRPDGSAVQVIADSRV
jgi:hypothetical protein